MSTIANEALLENIYDEVWEEFRISNKLTDDQLNELDGVCVNYWQRSSNLCCAFFAISGK